MLFLLAFGAVAVSITRFASAKVVIFGDTFRSRCLYLVDFGSGTAMCSAKKNIVVRIKKTWWKKTGRRKGCKRKKIRKFVGQNEGLRAYNAAEAFGYMLECKLIITLTA